MSSTKSTFHSTNKSQSCRIEPVRNIRLLFLLAAFILLTYNIWLSQILQFFKFLLAAKLTWLKGAIRDQMILFSQPAKDSTMYADFPVFLSASIRIRDGLHQNLTQSIFSDILYCLLYLAFEAYIGNNVE